MTLPTNKISLGKKANTAKLLLFGFKKKESSYVYHKVLNPSGFILVVTITLPNKIIAEIIDPTFNEPYAFYLVENASGTFAGTIKKQYEETLAEITATCFEMDVFQSFQTKELIYYIRETYAEELEFLWPKWPSNAIWRRKDTHKWYGVLLSVSKRKLGIESNESVEILNLRTSSALLESLIDHQTYFPAYHMNKKHWISLILDGSLPFKEICEKIDQSRQRAVK